MFPARPLKRAKYIKYPGSGEFGDPLLDKEANALFDVSNERLLHFEMKHLFFKLYIF